MDSEFTRPLWDGKHRKFQRWGLRVYRFETTCNGRSTNKMKEAQRGMEDPRPRHPCTDSIKAILNTSDLHLRI